MSEPAENPQTAQKRVLVSVWLALLASLSLLAWLALLATLTMLASLALLAWLAPLPLLYNTIIQLYLYKHKIVKTWKLKTNK